MALHRVQSEAMQTHSTRSPLYVSIGKRLNRRIVAFYTSFDGQAIIESPDAEIIEEVIAHTAGPDALTLVLSSPGGDGVEAERIVRVCRKRSKDDFEVIVPRMAKSAATLICMGANSITMSPTSELGPIDPQVPWRTVTGFRLFPTSTLVEVYDSLMTRAVQATGNVEPYLQQLQAFNAGEVQQWRKFERLTGELARVLLSCSQMSGLKEAEINRKIKIFTDAKRTLDHGRPIFFDAAQAAGLAIKLEPESSELWKDVWELHVRCSSVQQRQNFDKLCEGETHALYGGGRST